MSMRVALVVGGLLGLIVGNVSCREPCSLDTCAGCCDSKGECQLGTEAAACGKRGAVCSACNGACVKQVCTATDGGTAVVDAGEPPLPLDAGCAIGTCGSSRTCDFSSGQCETSRTCVVGTPQPSGCGAGQQCDSGGTCQELAKPNCPNFSTQSAPMRWNPSVSFGPAITGARSLSFGLVDAGCPTGALRRGLAELVAYDFRSRFFEDGGVPRLFLYRDNQTLMDVLSDQVVSVVPSNGGANAVIQISICAPDTVTALTQGFAFEGGNGVCVRFQ